MKALKIKSNDCIFFTLLLTFVLFTIIKNTVVIIGFLIILFVYIIKNLKNKEEMITLISLTLMLQMVFRIYTSGILLTICEYFDEFIAVIGCIYILLYALKNKRAFLKYERKIIFAIILLIIIGLMSNYIFGYQKVIPIFVDVLTYSKFIIYYLATRIYASENISGDILKKYFNTKIKIIVCFLFVLAILNTAIPSLYDVFDYRYFAYSLQLFFPHPTYLAAFCILCIIILLYNNEKGNLKYIFMTSFVTIFTFRTKAIVALFAITFIYIVAVKLKVKSNFLIIVCVLLGGIYIAYDQIQFYYLDNSIYTIRKEMTLDGIKLANDAFPLGTGFATFGSSPAFQFDSPLYYKLGYFTHSHREETLGDVFWPIVIAQNGWFGFLIYIYVIYCFIKYILKFIKKDAIFFVSYISIFVYQLIASTAETAFFGPTAPAYFVILGFIVYMQENKKYRSESSEK